MLYEMRDFQGCSRCCATCQWWEGERIADAAHGRVETPRHAGMGFCRSPASWWIGRAKQGESRCCFWEQWELVRGARYGPRHCGLVMLGPDMRDSGYPIPPRLR